MPLADFEDKKKAKMRSDDRILVLKIIDGKKGLSSIGIVDSRLFKGENNLHAIRNPRDSLWSLAYDEGVLPQPLKQRFTKFADLFKFVNSYMAKRNIEIKEVQD